MSGPHPSTATIRYAVRSTLADLAPGDVVLVACSGGGDSMALAEAVAHEQRHASWRGGAVVVDHGLQPGSDDVAARAAGWLRDLGLDPVLVERVTVSDTGSGLEAAARDGRHAALDAVAERVGAAVVLLGHTLDDQAEQVLLGLVRGSGARSLAGMPAARDRVRRPLLGVTRAQCRESCEAEGVPWWDDPMNDDPAFTRVRARRAVADLEADLGPGVAASLARSADQLREDADLLDALADSAVRELGPGPWAAADLMALPRPVRTRVWRRLLVAAGAPAGQVGTRHTEACDALLTRWRGQGPLHLPGDLRAVRAGGTVTLSH
ncbi:tRNA(Ile)-lysidine synthetase [Knoellia flava TL1]|uniref:tRNA(Ile)-lysidine synthase n=2 Tax=Knoellia flava TaxID=913969 RepID=A0A8H9KQR6_9MICO|nr:tRNA lysidine(34) synthetase TilS [Knoellia flava]KGN29557.1 tRNA(Ile)-lysidine synthetase [Knoellia flava TL1]GGB75439.1 tRNA(Ile)-lysidine synthase [Knoellia flava]